MDPATTQAVAKAAEETAKTVGKVADIAHDSGGYLRHVMGEVPADLVGVLGGAWVREQHIRLRDKLRRRTEQILRERDVQEVIELSPNLAAALIAGAQEEGKEALMELWARLLANAMDPNLNTVRQSFIEAVKKMDPMDAVVLRYILHKEGITLIHRADIENISTEIGRHSDDVEVSLRHLEGLLFFDYINTTWHINPTCRVFLRACYPEVKTEKTDVSDQA
jgi:hypothetical protein